MSAGTSSSDSTESARSPSTTESFRLVDPALTTRIRLISRMFPATRKSRLLGRSSLAWRSQGYALEHMPFSRTHRPPAPVGAVTSTPHGGSGDDPQAAIPAVGFE